jgi:hypothetical protein
MKDRMIGIFEELSELFDGTLNHFHMLAFSSEISSNKVFMFQEAMKKKINLTLFKQWKKKLKIMTIGQ